MRILENGLDDFLAVVKENTSWMFDGAEEIGTSDISCCVLSVLKEYYKDPKTEATNLEFQLTRNAVRNCL